MSVLRNIMAVMTAISIASPLCCCDESAAARGSVSEKSCCSQESTTTPDCPGGPSCPECRAKDPRLVEAVRTVTFTVDLPELAPLSLFAVVPALPGDGLHVSDLRNLPDPGPPGWRLVFHQIFLI
jgi:hypothetical protein